MAGDLNRRETQRRILIRLQTFAASAEFETASLVLLQEKERQLKNAFEKFKEEHLNIVEASEPEHLEVQHETLEAAENVYIAAHVLYVTRIDAMLADQEEREIERNRQRDNSFNTANGERADEIQNQNRAENNFNAIRAHNAEARNANHSEIQLERFRLPMFYGEQSQWCEWRSSYDSLVHSIPNISNTHKFHILKSRVSGAAGRVLSGWNITGETYQAAYDTLVKVYENKYRIIMALLDDFHRMPELKAESLEGIRTMLDTTNRVIRQLQINGSPVDTWDEILSYNLLTRMPPKTLSEWETTQNHTEMPTLQDILNFLEKRSNGYTNLNRLSNQISAEQPEGIPRKYQRQF